MTESSIIGEAFTAAGLDQDCYAYVPKPGPPTPLRSFVGVDTILTVAVDDEGRRRNLIEQRSREWASRHGINTPAVLDASPLGSWLLGQRIAAGEPAGPGYVHAALDTADRIAAADPPDLPVAASRWRASRRSRLARLVRALRGRLDLVRFLQLRRQLGGLDDLTTSHGDFYRRNVLSLGDQVSVVDWEFVGVAPRWTDQLRIWSTLLDPADRLVAWDRIVDGAGDDRRHLSVLAQWLACRLLAENLAAPVAQQNPADLGHARRVWTEARALTAALR